MSRIDITGVDLVEFAKAIYELSVPMGLGFRQYAEGGLSDEDARGCVGDDDHIALNMDYVRGRACKMLVFRENGRLLIDSPWRHHTDHQFGVLLARFGVASTGLSEHVDSCNCDTCIATRMRNGK